MSFARISCRQLYDTTYIRGWKIMQVKVLIKCLMVRGIVIRHCHNWDCTQ
jgi:hypothetical protein